MRAPVAVLLGACGTAAATTADAPRAHLVAQEENARFETTVTEVRAAVEPRGSPHSTFA